MEQLEYNKQLKKYHKISPRHVLVLETNLSVQEKGRIFHYSKLEKNANNELTHIMSKRLEQLTRTKKYRNLKRLYGKYVKEDLKEKMRGIALELNRMQQEYNVTWNYCRTYMIKLSKKYHLDSIFALTIAENVWRGVEKCLYSDGTKLHYLKKEDFPSIRAKQINRGIILFVKDNQLNFKFKDIKFGVKIKDRFENDEVCAVVNYLENSNNLDKLAVETMENTGECISTYRPCYATLVCKKIRGKLRVYVHITTEGTAKPKCDKNGDLKHKLGVGKVGCDIGTQTIAYTSFSKVGLKNLAERGSSVSKNERKERLIYRAMERSRRINNQENYNEDGTVKKGPKIWHYSNRYKKLRIKHQKLNRVNKITRHLAINEDVNILRSLGNIFITEPKNAKKLQKRAKITTINSKGKINRKKRFGKSIKNRCCGYFQSQVEKKFKNTGGAYIEVPNNYCASQYDHTADLYIKKKLSDRMLKLEDGTEVQRDWYSSYLLYNINLEDRNIDKVAVKKNFENMYLKEQKLIEWIKNNRIKILNSGIKFA